MTRTVREKTPAGPLSAEGLGDLLQREFGVPFQIYDKITGKCLNGASSQGSELLLDPGLLQAGSGAVVVHHRNRPEDRPGRQLLQPSRANEAADHRAQPI